MKHKGTNDSLGQELPCKDGIAELWMTKEGRVVFVLPLWEHRQHVVGGLFHHATCSVAKMLWYDDIDHDWMISEIDNHLDYKVGEVNLLDILTRQETDQEGLLPRERAFPSAS